MSSFGLAITMCLVFLFSAWGWGQLIQFFCRIPLLRLSSFATVSGLAILSAVGGVLNLVGQAKTGMIGAVVLAGIGIAIAKLLRERPWTGLRRWAARLIGDEGKKRRATFFIALPSVLAFIGGLTACACLMPTSLFNWHDDFQTYFPRIARMLQTGSVGGNPFDGMGLDGLGGQTFLQGFFLLTGDVRLLNGFDAVCCFFLALWMVAQCAWRVRLPAFFGVLAVGSAAVINPQCVNISPLYSSLMVTMALLVWGEALARQLLGSTPPHWGIEIVGALLIALLASLKVTVAVFPAIYLALLFLLLSAHVPGKLLWRSAAITLGGAAFFVLPWVLNHWPTIRRARAIAGQLHSEGLIATDDFSMAAHDVPQLFSFRPLYYGDSLLAYHLIVLATVAAAFVAFLRWRRMKNSRASLIPVIAAGPAVFGICFVNAHFFAIENAVRYSIPVLIGCFSMALIFLGAFGPNESRSQHILRVIPGLVAMLGVMVLFGTTFWNRMRSAVQTRSILAFPVEQGPLHYCKNAVSREEGLWVRDQQRKIEPNKTTLVWVATPFHLDFVRNDVMTISDPGFINPALHLPVGCTPEAFARFLLKWGIRSVMLDVSGPAIKDITVLELQAQSEDAISQKLSERGIFFRRSLQALQQGHVVHSDNRTILFDLAPARASAVNAGSQGFPP